MGAAGNGRWQPFKRDQNDLGNSIYWSNTRGAIKVVALMRTAWAAQDWERGQWGYPLQDSVKCARDTNSNGSADGSGQKFDGGWSNKVLLAGARGWCARGVDLRTDRPKRWLLDATLHPHSRAPGSR
ncbi:LGFP repeat-containing protein [Rhodococcus sp. G-MC3]|uniref:LGFP repeat-containing protein n=1 Tax=Rhodococcus sp. G-MC3 TaxID=3046209 RepID=UPI003FA74CD4